MPLELTTAGLSTQRLAEILEDLKTAFQNSTVFGKNVKLGAETAEGQLIGIFGEREEKVQELLQELWDAWNPDGAMGVFADFLAGLVGVRRKEATYSKVVLTDMDVDNGETLPAGAQARVPNAGIFATDDDLVGDGSGTQEVNATAIVTGPVEAAAGTITEILTNGDIWHAVSNDEKAIEGTNTESTTALLARREDSLQAGGTARPAAIEAHVEKLEDVQTCWVEENLTLETDEDLGIPGKSMGIYIWPTGVDGQAVAQAIWEQRGAATLAWGTQVYTITDAKGKEQTIAFSFGELSEIHADIQVTTNDEWPSDGIAQVTAAVKLWDNDFTLKTKVLPDDLRDFIRDTVAGIDHLRIRIKEGAAPGEEDTGPIYLPLPKVAYFDANISVYTA